MNLEECTKILEKPIESNNKGMIFTFSFTSPKSGNVNAYDTLLEVNIVGEWEFIETENDVMITIDGFDIVKFGTDGLKCKVSELEEELKIIDSAYDLCFGS